MRQSWRSRIKARPQSQNNLDKKAIIKDIHQENVSGTGYLRAGGGG